MAFEGAITGENLIRSTWTDATVLSSDSEAAAYLKENAIDGNTESQWRAAVNGAKNIVIDSADDSLDMDYLCMWFSIDNLPTSVKIETSSDNISYSTIANTYDTTVSTTLSANLDGTSRIIPMNSVIGFNIGNTVRIDSDKRYLVVSVGANYIEIDRLPDAYSSGDLIEVYPGPVIIAAVSGAESKRYIRITVTGTPAHVLEVQAFKIKYVFDNSILPLNAFPIGRQLDVGPVERSFSGYGIGRMQTGPSRSQFRLQMARMFRDAIRIFEWVTRQNRIGILLDDGTWYEVMPMGTIDISRRPSTDAELVSYVAQIVYQEV
jgi:hypothetical protein